MLVKLSTLALAIPFTSALTILSTSGWTTGGVVTLQWSASTEDPPVFSVELVNTDFHNTFAIANNVQTINGQITIELPQVPVEGGYTLQFVAPNNVNQIYAQSGTFDIGPATTSTGSASSSSGTPLTTASPVTSGTLSTLSTPSVTATTPVSSASSASFVSALPTTGSSSAASSTPSSFNSSGAASFKLAGIAPAAALVLSAVAGAVMVF